MIIPAARNFDCDFQKLLTHHSVYVMLIYRYCTSIVSQDSKGQIWHSRNLDYGETLTDLLKNNTITVDFQTAGKVSFKIGSNPTEGSGVTPYIKHNTHVPLE